MRLVCPNCSAQYEIDGSMIPDEGRDVQCSNCGHTWFELPPPSADFGEISTEDFDDLDLSEPDTGTASEEHYVTETADEEETEAVLDEVDDDDDDDDDEHPSRAAATVAAAAAAALADEDEEDFEDFDTALKPRRPADAASLDILREEAERELSQRRAPASESIETQTDLGIDDIRNRRSPSRALRARMAHLGEEQPETRPLDEVEVETAEPEYPDTSDEDADYAEPRRDLLPDIDEINSTLKPARRRAAQTRTKQGNGFLVGFMLMVLLTASLIFAYAQAPAIARALPSTESKLISYVDSANGIRDWLQGLIGG